MCMRRGAFTMFVLMFVCAVSSLTSASDTSACVAGCSCNATDDTVICANIRDVPFIEVINTIPLDTRVFEVNNGYFPTLNYASFLGKNFTQLEKLVLKDCNISAFDPNIFIAMVNLRELDLQGNTVKDNLTEWFHHLPNLELLNLSHNSINNIDNRAFTALTNLKILDLGFNKLETLADPGIFAGLESIQVINLNNNKLSYLHPAIFRQLGLLTNLNLNSNQIEHIPSELFANTTSLEEIHLGDNPWHCHCGVEWLITAMHSNDSLPTYMNSHSVQCHLPGHLTQVRIRNLDSSQLQCEEPEIDVIPVSDDFLTWHHYFLHCNATGYPQPSIYWKTPRGILAHPSQQQFLPADIVHFQTELSFSGYPYREAKIKALSNGSLEFIMFRHNYAGNYTCFATNPLGTESVFAIVETDNEIYWNMVISVIFGGMVSFLFLIFGIIFGAIRACAEKCCCKHGSCCCVDSTKIIYDDENYEDEAEFWDEYFRHPLDSHRATPDIWPSPVKCITPVEPTELSDLNKTIFNTLQDVRSRLNVNMGRHMEHMRTRANHMRDTGKNLRIDMSKKVERVRYKAYLMRESAGMRMVNLRESGSQTLRNFRSSSGQYAHRMREGMVVRVEAVKYSVKSFKEFCGQGQLGQTISVPSISTNVDSQETEQVYKTVTFV